MDFFDRQIHARRQSRRLAWLLGLALLAALAINNLLLCSLIACVRPMFSEYDSVRHAPSIFLNALNLLAEALMAPGQFAATIFRPQPIIWISLGTLLSIAGGSWYKIRRLAEGGTVVAEFLGGRRVTAGTTDLDERRLRDVVEEMAIASGLPVPEIFVLDCERGINTFAAGHTHDDAAIGVTRGCLKLLNRDELQGVIAHEFSHILYGDTRLNMRLIGLAHGFFWPTLLGRVLIYGQSTPLPPDASVLVEKDKVNFLPTAPLGALLVFLGCFSLPFVRLIKSAICRQREWLADAAAVQFTRNPDGIAGALKKIGGLLKQGRLNTPYAEMASHLYLADWDYEPWLAFLATHPPLDRRVKAIEPDFDGSFPKVKMLDPSQKERDRAYAKFLAGSMAIDRVLVPVPGTNFPPITSDHLRQAALIRLALPDEIKTALQTPDGAAVLVYCLLLSDDETVCCRQQEILQTNLEPAVYGQFQTLRPLVAALEERYKLPLAESAVPALRENDAGSHQAFGSIQQQIIDCNGSLDLFEYTLIKMVQRQLRAYFQGPVTAQPRFGRVQEVLPPCTILLSALAHVGDDDESAARAAFARGAEFLDTRGEAITFLTRSEWDLAGVDAALGELAAYHEPLRRNVLLACGKTVAADGHVTLRESELLRAIAEALNCPMPPFVEALRSEELAATE
jgi:Zn-dependent protease with chaperone function